MDYYDRRKTNQISVKHHTQKYNWDCGISCLIMVLPEDNRCFLLDNKSKICREEGFNTSTWTIDLCYLLKKFEVKHIYYTITLGVHPAYSKINYYNRIFTKDGERVNKRFREAEKYGIIIHQGTISCSSILEHLTVGPVIVLTNAKLLSCDVCKYNKLGSEVQKMLRWPVRYQGHYIVLCGFDVKIQRVYYRNPTLTDRICVMSIKALDEARKSYGTDEDTIFIHYS